MREIYLAGGCYWGAEKYLSGIRGVCKTEVGFANGHTVSPTYEQVKHEDTGFAETVRVQYDEQQLTLSALLRLFFRIIDPTSINQQGEDVGDQYRTGVYWVDAADKATVQAALERLQHQVEKPVVVEALPLKCFYPAEEYHQKYLDKNPGGYCHVSWGMIDWVKTVDPMQMEE